VGYNLTRIENPGEMSLFIAIQSAPMTCLITTPISCYTDSPQVVIILPNPLKDVLHDQEPVKAHDETRST
jgi:hypothetical protein